MADNTEELVRLRVKKEELRRELGVFAEIEELTDGQQTRFEDLCRAWDKVTEEEAVLVGADFEESRAAKLDQIRSAAAGGGNVHTESGDGGANAATTRKSAGTYGGNPWKARSADHRTYAGHAAGEVRGRALEAIQRAVPDIPDEVRERATQMVEQDEDPADSVARYMLVASDPAYRSAFLSWLKNPTQAHLGWDEAQRDAMRQVEHLRTAMNEGTPSAGGLMVPAFLDPAVVLTNNGSISPMRELATVKTIGTQTWKGISSAGVSAEWAAEAAEMTDASPTIAQPTITPIRADAYVQASWEMEGDTEIAAQLTELFTDARVQLENVAFVVGTGSTQPYGLVTRLQLTTASRVATNTNAVFGPVDIFATDNALPQRHRPNASWMANRSIFNLARQFATGSGPQHAYWVDLGGRRPAELIGYPTYEASSMFAAPLSTATASNDDLLILGDFRKYYVVDRLGSQIIHDPQVRGANRRPTGESSWTLWWRTGGDVVDANAFRMLRA